MFVLLGILFGFSILYCIFKVQRILPYLKTSGGGSFSRGKVIIVMLSLFFLNAFGFWAISDVFTIPPAVVSGNGNPAILLMIPLMPLFALFLFALAMISYNLFFGTPFSANLIVLLMCLILFVLCIFGEMEIVNQLISALGGSPSEQGSRIYRFGWVNQYTNPFYFNWLTLGMAIFVTVMASGIWAELHRFSKRNRTA